MAAKSLGMDVVPCIRLGHLSDEQRRAYIITDNKLAENAGWNAEMLQLEMADLNASGFDMGLLGFNDQDLATYLQPIQPTNGLTDPDDVPLVAPQPSSRRGDLWMLGHHRVYCGDTTSLKDTEHLFGGAQADMVFCDPPYNVAYTGKTKEKLTIQNDNMSSEDFFQFLHACFVCMSSVTVQGGAIYVCHADIETVSFRRAMTEAGFLVKQSIIWVKNAFILGRADYHWQHEPILYGWKDGKAHRWYGDRKKSTVWESLHGMSIIETDDGVQVSMTDGEHNLVIKVPSYEVVPWADGPLKTVWRMNKPLKNEDHPTMKPVDVPRRGIENSSLNGHIVFDSFLGSGSTLIACEQSGRICYGMELDPRYIDVIVRRWQNFTGKQATLEGDGRTFDEIAVERSA
jgi:DNA modification methylase